MAQIGTGLYEKFEESIPIRVGHPGVQGRNEWDKGGAMPR